MTARSGPLAALLVASLAACSSAGARPDPASQQRAPSKAAATRSSSPPAVSGYRSVRGYAAVAEPVRLRIPQIGVDTRLQHLGQARDRTIEVPTRWGVAGWYAQGPRPGDDGDAVLLGHVDSRNGPAVFFRLADLRRGDRIEIERADRAVVRFAVTKVGRYDKRRFPTNDVYYPTLEPALRLVTCGGEFDARAGHYRSNVIAFARLVR
jgi:sortase (surface protein transpeptidase)